MDPHNTKVDVQCN